MIEEGIGGTLDFCALRDAIERRDPGALLGFYSEDAELRVEHAALPGGGAFELKGRAQIGRYLGVVSEQVALRLVGDGGLDGEGSIRFREICFYPDGAAIYVQTALELEGGAELAPGRRGRARRGERAREGSEKMRRRATTKAPT